MHATEAHKQELDKNEPNEHVLLKCARFQEQAEQFYTEFNLDVQEAAKLGGIDFSSLGELELVRSKAMSLGQEWHMDTKQGRWNVSAPFEGELGHIPITVLAAYVAGYYDYPANLTEAANIPAKWDVLEQLDLKWKLGDILFFRTNYIHKGPPNKHPTPRGIIFGSEDRAHATHEEHTDTKVITNKIFNTLRKHTSK